MRRYVKKLVNRPRDDGYIRKWIDPLQRIGIDHLLQLDAVVAAFDGSLREVMEQVVEWNLQTGTAA